MECGEKGLDLKLYNEKLGSASVVLKIHNSQIINSLIAYQ